jgi:hypothetical protein
LNEDFLQHIVGFRFFMDNAIDGGSQSFAVPAVQLGKGVMAPARNTSHQHLIRRRCYSRLIKSGPNHA